MIKVTHEGKEQIILTVRDGMTWSGAKDSAVRTLDFEFLYNPLKPDIPKCDVACGDDIEFIENEKTKFLGRVEALDYSTEADIVKVHCTDLLSNLKRSKCVGRFKGTLNELAGVICGLFNITNGINIDNPTIHNIVSTGDKTYYDVLFEACESLNIKAQLYMDGSVLKFTDNTAQATFKIGETIRASYIRQDASKLVNKVLIIDDNGFIVNKFEKPDLISKYGLYQDVYNYNKKSKNNVPEEDVLIKNIENLSEIVCDNNNNCISGRYIEVEEPVNRYRGLFQIKTDTHTLSADSVMTLEIEFVEKTENT